MALPSLLDIITVIVLIAPGFLSFIIIKALIPTKRKTFSDFELTLYSLLYALPIITSYGLATGVRDIDSIKDSLFDFWNLAMLLGLAFLWGAIPGGIAKLLTRGEYVLSNCWDEFWERLAEGAYVLVYTEDGREYKGWIQYADKSEEKSELILADPKLILRDSDWKIVNEIEMGLGLLFTERDIRRVVSLKPAE